MVGKGLDDLPVLALGAEAADPLLIDDGGGALEVRGETAVDDGVHNIGLRRYQRTAVRG